MRSIVTGELEKGTYIWMKSLTWNIAQTEALLDHCDELPFDDAEYKQARWIVNLVFDMNEEVFERIAAGGEKMRDELKNMN